MLTNSLLLAIVALLEHVANVKFHAEKHNYPTSVNIDLAAVGLANMVGSLFGSFLVAGGFSRTALNARARSQVNSNKKLLIFFLFIVSSRVS